MADEKKSGGGMTVREAGRKGGQKVRDERGHAFYEEIGRKGGETVRDQRGHEFYEEIGHKGGQKVKELIEAGKRRAQEAVKPPGEEGIAPKSGATSGGSLASEVACEPRQRLLHLGAELLGHQLDRRASAP